MTKHQLIITTRGKRDHHATCGEIKVSAETEIGIVQKLARKGIHLEDFHHHRTYGLDYPYTWIWVPRT